MTRPSLSDIERKSAKNRAAHNKKFVTDLIRGVKTQIRCAKFEGKEYEPEVNPVSDAKVAQPAVAQRQQAPGKPTTLKLSESEVLKGCMSVLELHPLVAFWWRQNTGAVKVDNRFIKFSFKGASDLMFVTVKGVFGARECKATGKGPSDDQIAFLDNVESAGGIACCVDRPDLLSLVLNSWLNP